MALDFSTSSAANKTAALLLDHARPEPRVCARFHPQGRDGASKVAGQDAPGGYGRGGCDRAAAADADEVETGVIVTEEGIEESEESFSTRPFRKGMHWKQVL